MNSEDIIKETKQPIIGVYKISNLVSDRYYIGYSKNINKRFRVHRCKLKNSCHAAKGHKNPDVIIDIAKGTSIIISFSVGFEV